MSGGAVRVGAGATDFDPFRIFLVIKKWPFLKIVVFLFQLYTSMLRSTMQPGGSRR